MNRLLAVFSLCLPLAPMHGAETGPQRFEWVPTVSAGKATFGWESNRVGDRVLKVVNESNLPTTIALGVIEDPDIHSAYYGIDGRVRYQGVEGDSYLEMWNHFPGTNASQPSMYFSRTVAEDGLLQKLSGDSDWRAYRLPFNHENSGSQPHRLVVNLRLPGPGTVWLEAASLNSYPDPNALLTHTGAWWSNRHAGWIGGGVGVVFGCWGALLGLLAQTGRGRSFVTASVRINVGLGIVSLILGLVALVVGQPYAVYYPLLLIGILLPAVMLGTRKSLQKQFTAAEERRMAALDAIGPR